MGFGTLTSQHKMVNLNVQNSLRHAFSKLFILNCGPWYTVAYKTFLKETVFSNKAELPIYKGLLN